MNTHAKIAAKERDPSAPLVPGRHRRGRSCARLSAVPGCWAPLGLAATAKFDPSVWYSIAPDGIVTVTCRQGRHGPAHRLDHGADHRRRTWLGLEGHAGSARSNDPKYNDPVLGAQITGGSWSTMMNYDAMSRAGAAGRMALTKPRRGMMGVPASELVVPESRVSHPKSGSR